MTKKELREQLSELEEMAKASKFGRLLRRPVYYLNAILQRDLLKVKEKPTTCDTFFGIPMHIVLPSATDIYITKGKSHPSEIRLAKFLIENLEQGDYFLDIGAHYGYFSLLASVLVGEHGRVTCFEAAPSTYKVLKKNVQQHKNIEAINQAASDQEGSLTFYQFTTKYSEYNSMDVEQYKGQEWFKRNPPNAVEVSSQPLDNFLRKSSNPKVIKIDVEGAELKVLEGMQRFLKENDPILVMEYIASDNPNSSHQQASRFLDTLGYHPYAINQKGELVLVSEIETYMREQNQDSDNIVFIKKIL